MSASLVVVGDALLDRDVHGTVERIAPDAPVPVLDETNVAARPGGAGLAAALAALDGREVTLVTALGDDPAGAELARALHSRGVEVIDVGLDGPTPEKIRLMCDRRPLLRLDRGGGGTPAAATAAARAAIGWAGAVLVADYGRGMAVDAGVRTALEALPGDVPVVWDPHPRGPAPVSGVALATPNHAEAELFAAEPSGAVDDVGRRAHDLRVHWGARAVCVTCGEHGAVLARPQSGPVTVAAPHATGGDPCGAGDRFAVRAAEVLAEGGEALDAVSEAVAAASAFVASGGAGATLARHAARGALVATGGCFDLLHVGHIRTLEAARALGSRLVVCLNSDASVRRLKGPQRPLVPEAERAAVLQALECVDEVVIFHEDTPEVVLDRLRPDIWAKGGDYSTADLPEVRVLARWGGRVAILPYLDGRSTTALIQEVNLHAAS